MRAFLVGLIVVAAIVGGLLWGQRALAIHTAASKEAELEAPERKKCEALLASFQAAWAKYRKEHKGREPGAVADLVPKYIKAESLICPTAQRLIRDKMGVDAGQFRVGSKDYLVTYGFMWLTAGYARTARVLGDRAPLVECAVHREAMYRAIFKKKPQLGALDAADLNPEVAHVPVLAVLRNGTVQAASQSSR